MMIKGILIVNAYLQQKKFDDIYGMILNSFLKKDIEMTIKTNAEIAVSISVDPNLHTDFILFWDKDILLCKHLESFGYKIFNNAYAIETCDDKALTAVALAKSGILMPKTIISPFTYTNIGYCSFDFIDKAIEELGLPLVMKLRKSSFGKDVFLMSNKDDIIEKLKTSLDTEWIFQEYISTSFGMDIRLHVVGSKVVAAVKRIGKKGDFRANVTNGGQMFPYEPSFKEKEMAIKVCQILKLDFGGVDILFGKNDEPILCEVNSNAHFKNLYDATGIDISTELVDYIISKI